MPSPASKIKGLFHRRDKSLGHDEEPTSPSAGSLAAARTSAGVQPLSYESAPQRQAPRIGDKPLPNDGRTSTDRSDRPNSGRFAAAPMTAPPNGSSRARASQDGDLSKDMGQMNLNGRDSGAPRRSSDVFGNTRGQAPPLTLSHGQISEDGDWNLGQVGDASTSRATAAPSNRTKVVADPISARAGERASLDRSVDDAQRRGSVSRKPVRSVDGIQSRNLSGIEGGPQSQVKREEQPIVGKSSVLRDGQYLVKDAAVAPSLEGVVDLSQTEDTTVHERWAPAVTHDTVHQHVHHSREEQITRDIHYHDIYHRILPITDVQVLPARHFVPTSNGELLEISEDQIPGRTNRQQNWIVAETVSKGPHSAPLTKPRQFTARNFEGKDGDYREYKGKDGIARTDTTWVHAPEIEPRGQLTGQTAPFYFGSADPADDGLRLDIPDRLDAERMPLQGSLNEMGEVLGTRRGESGLSGSTQAGALNGVQTGAPNGVPPPVPAHKELPRQDKAFV